MLLSWPKWSTCCFDFRVESTFGFEMISMVLGVHLSECTCISENPRLPLSFSLSQDGGADLNDVESAGFGMHIHFLDMSSCLKSMVC